MLIFFTSSFLLDPKWIYCTPYFFDEVSWMLNFLRFFKRAQIIIPFFSSIISDNRDKVEGNPPIVKSFQPLLFLLYCRISFDFDYNIFINFRLYFRQSRYWQIAKYRFLVTWNGIKKDVVIQFLITTYIYLR